MKTTITKEEFINICSIINELYTDVSMDYLSTKSVYSQEVYDQVLIEDYLYSGLAQCIYLDIVPYETLTDEAINAVMELYSDYQAQELV